MKTESKFKKNRYVAAEIADSAHTEAGSKYDGYAYILHLIYVGDVLIDFGFGDNEDIMTAAYLHDAIEDTGLGLNAILELFGPEVTALVSAVTDEPGKNRKERKVKTYPKIRAVAGATALKLADRIANVEYSIKTKNKKMLAMYAKEHEEFERELRVRGDLEPMWQHLNKIIATVI